MKRLILALVALCASVGLTFGAAAAASGIVTPTGHYTVGTVVNCNYVAGLNQFGAILSNQLPTGRVLLELRHQCQSVPATGTYRYDLRHAAVFPATTEFA